MKTHFHTESISALKHVAFFYVLIIFSETNVVHSQVAINLVNPLRVLIERSRLLWWCRNFTPKTWRGRMGEKNKPEVTRLHAPTVLVTWLGLAVLSSVETHFIAYDLYFSIAAMKS